MTNSSLPKGWCLVKFGELAESITERVEDPKAAGVEIYVGLEHLDSDTTKISRYGIPEDVESTKLRFYPGDVIYAKRRAYQRKLGVAEVVGICSAHALVLRARPEVCLPEFLPYFLQSDQFHERALSISVGSLSPTINWKTLVVQEFALPPIAEQHRIVELLSTIDLVLESEKDCLEKVKDAVISTSVEFLEDGKVTREPFKKVAAIQRGASYKSSDYSEDGKGRPFLTLKAVTRDGQFSSTGVKWVKSDFVPANVAKTGDLFFANTDLTPGRLLVGAPFFFTGTDGKEAPCFSMDLSRVLVIDNRFSSEYLYFALNLPRIRKNMRQLTGGSTVGHLRLTGVEDIEIPILKPHQISAFLSIVRTLIEFQMVCTTKIDSTRELRRSLVEQLLSGVSDV